MLSILYPFPNVFLVYLSLIKDKCLQIIIDMMNFRLIYKHLISLIIIAGIHILTNNRGRNIKLVTSVAFKYFYSKQKLEEIFDTNILVLPPLKIHQGHWCNGLWLIWTKNAKTRKRSFFIRSPKTAAFIDFFFKFHIKRIVDYENFSRKKFWRERLKVEYSSTRWHH